MWLQLDGIQYLIKWSFISNFGIHLSKTYLEASNKEKTLQYFGHYKKPDL